MYSIIIIISGCVDAVEAICFIALLSIDHSGGTRPGLGAHPKR